MIRCEKQLINLVENFKVGKVILNCGEFNELEQDFIKVLDKKKIPYYSCIKELNIDVLKVWHYGSRTSSSKKFIREIEPKYLIINAGKNNRYGHPNDSVLENLKYSKIYRTDSIMFKIMKNNIKNKTKNKLMFEDKVEVNDLVPNPILIKNKGNIEIITEKVLQN